MNRWILSTLALLLGIMIVNTAWILSYDYYYGGSSDEDSVTSSEGTDTQPADTDLADTKPTTQILAATDTVQYSQEGLSFSYPKALGTLTPLENKTSQITFESDQESAGLIVYHPESGHLVFSILEDNFNRLYIFNKDSQLRKLRQYEYRDDEFNPYFLKPQFSPTGEYILLTVGAYETSSNLLFDLTSKDDYWQPEISLNHLWTNMEDGEYKNVYWTQNDQYLAIISSIARLGSEGSPAIFAANLTGEFSYNKWLHQVYETADPLLANQPCNDSDSKICDFAGELLGEDGADLFKNVRLSEEGLLSFTVHNVLVDAPDQEFYYDISKNYLYPAPS